MFNFEIQLDFYVYRLAKWGLTSWQLKFYTVYPACENVIKIDRVIMKPDGGLLIAICYFISQKWSLLPKIYSGH